MKRTRGVSDVHQRVFRSSRLRLTPSVSLKREGTKNLLTGWICDIDMGGDFGRSAIKDNAREDGNFIFIIFRGHLSLRARARGIAPRNFRVRKSLSSQLARGSIEYINRMLPKTSLTHARARATFRRFIIVVRLEIFALIEKKNACFFFGYRSEPGRPCAL